MNECCKEVIRTVLEVIDNYPIPVGNSSAGELASDWTYQALQDIKEEILEKVKDL